MSHINQVRRGYGDMGFKPLSPLYASSKASLWGEAHARCESLLLRFLPSNFKDLYTECWCLEVGGAFIGWAWERILVTVNVALRGMWGSSTLFFFPCVTVSCGGGDCSHHRVLPWALLPHFSPQNSGAKQP